MTRRRGRKPKTRSRAKELAALPERDAIAARLKEVFYVDSLGEPMHRGNRYFVSLKKATDEKSIFYVREGKTGTDKVLLNPNDWAADGSASLGTIEPSHDGHYVAYTVRMNNSDEATMYVIDVTTGKKLIRRRDSRRQIRERFVDAEERRLLLHVAPDRPHD